MNLNSSPNLQQIVHDNDDYHHYDHNPFGLVTNNSSSNSSVSCRIFFNSNQDHMGYYDHHQTDYSYGGSTYEIKNNENSGLRLSLWKKEDQEDNDDHEKSNSYPVKWMCSKMRVMQKMKKPDDEDRTALNASKIEDDRQKNMQPYNSSISSMESSDHLISTNNCSYYSNNNSSPIRVCADCNTTKTPLWRSGPKGPKSLCNACGIRQRKARRAMAAAANGVAADQLPPAKIKVQLYKQKKIGKNGHAHANSQLKIKRCKTTPVADSACGNNGDKKSGNNLEDFLINLSKNLSFHRVFPEDEKDAAILLMALSSGLVHG